jgi:HK97 family phage major capsid protein
MATIAERITQLREDRARIDKEQRELLDTAAGENRGLTAEEREKDDKLTEAWNDKSAELRRFEAAKQREDELRGEIPEAVTASASAEGADRRHSRRDRRVTEEYRRAADQYLRTGMVGLSTDERSVLQAGVDADGGVTVAETWRKQLIETQRQFSAIRTFAEIIETETGGDFHLPRVAHDATPVTIVPEGTTIPDDAEDFDEVVMKAYPYKKITKANEEAVQDLGFDVGGFVSRRVSEDIALIQGAHFTIGTGSNQPHGLASFATVGKTSAAPTAITTDEVYDLIYSVTRPYRINGNLLCNDQTINALRKLKDSVGEYLWQPAVQQGEPDRFGGYPVAAEPFFDTIAATKVVMGFGDIFRAYAIRDAGTLMLRFLGERYADQGQVAWRGTLRSDGNIKDQNAFKTLQMHA